MVFPCTDFQKLKNKTILKIFKKSTIIPNAINNKKIILNKIKLKNNNNFTILFGAQNLDQKWKGTDIVIKMIKKFSHENVNFIIFGKTKKFLDFLKMKKRSNI